MSAPSPPPRGRRFRPWRDVEFASLDFETTGLDAGRDRIVSFGVVPILNGRVVVGERAYREVSPGVPPRPSSVAVHGLREVDLGSAPAIDEAKDDLRTALDRRFIVAWSADVEAAFLATTFGGSARGWRRRIVDAIPLARRVDGSDLRRPASYSLSAAAERFGVPVHSPHDALDDALTTAQVFVVLATRLSRRRTRTARWLLRAGRSRRRRGF